MGVRWLQPRPQRHVIGCIQIVADEGVQRVGRPQPRIANVLDFIPRGLFSAILIAIPMTMATRLFHANVVIFHHWH